MSLFAGLCRSKSLRREGIIFNECALRLLKGSAVRVVGQAVPIADIEIAYYKLAG